MDAPDIATAVKTPSTPSQASPPPTATSLNTVDVVRLLDRIRGGIETLLERGGIDARASRQGQVQYKVGACVACRAAKTKCSQGNPCERCKVSGATCEYLKHVRRGRKSEPTPNALLLASLLTDADNVYSAITGKAVDQKPLDVLRGAKASIVRVPPSQAAPPTLQHLAISEQPEDEHHDYGSTESDNDADSSPLPASAETSSTAINFGGLISNPLAVLAHIASGPKAKLETTEQESGTSMAFLPAVYDSVASADQYFSTGLYEIRLDVMPEVDPVNLGILSSQQLKMVMDFYFSTLYPSSFYLDPRVHTPELLRNVSPFLTTVLAYIVSAYVPALAHLVPALYEHVLLLSNRIFAFGYKSLEIVQAYCLLAEWAPAPNNWGSDRQWSWIGQARRIATEVRLDKSTNFALVLRYASATAIPEQAQELFTLDRKRTWTLLFITEIAVSVSTGRFEAMSGLNFKEGFRAQVPDVDPKDPLYNLTALEALHRIYAKSLMLAAGLREEMSPSPDSTNTDIRDAFMASYTPDLQAWQKRWTAASSQVLVMSGHAQTILLTISLQFPGPVLPVLNRCRSSALKTVRVIAEKPDPSLLYGPSALVTAMAYAATLLLRIEGLVSSSGGKSEYATVRPLCCAVASTLEKMAAQRGGVRTYASLHATRIRSLLGELDALPSSSAALTQQPSAPVPAAPVPVDLNFDLALDASSLLADLTPYDNTLFGPSVSTTNPDLSWLDQPGGVPPDVSGGTGMFGASLGGQQQAMDWPTGNWWATTPGLG
ncbi:hypothetical protein JCM6882_007462 [Rhodosporidiobolus microsporus]